ncbi:alpha/beta-hydrolase [Hypomontagnella monticulosa]|nr:alpha/beta-hydrolase [Hypomontagnella monticulosa]
MNIPVITVEPSEPHTHTVVFLHGRGDNMRRFAASLADSRDSRGRSLINAFPSFRWVFPQAPMRKCASIPETWPQWFDVWDVRDFAVNEDLQAVGLKEVVPAIRSILADEAALLGGRWERVVLAGISMGGATAAHILFNLDIPQAAGGRLGAFIGFSCRCPFAGRSLAGMRNVLGLEGAPDHGRIIQNTPVLLEHCADDPLVLVQGGRGLRDTLRGFGAQVEWKEYPSGGHWFHSPTGIDDVVDFLNKHLKEERSTDIPRALHQSSSSAMDLS